MTIEELEALKEKAVGFEFDAFSEFTDDEWKFIDALFPRVTALLLIAKGAEMAFYRPRRKDMDLARCTIKQGLADLRAAK